jgi:hypothetical protein
MKSRIERWLGVNAAEEPHLLPSGQLSAARNVMAPHLDLETRMGIEANHKLDEVVSGHGGYLPLCLPILDLPDQSIKLAIFSPTTNTDTPIYDEA